MLVLGLVNSIYVEIKKLIYLYIMASLYVHNTKLMYFFIWSPKSKFMRGKCFFFLKYLRLLTSRVGTKKTRPKNPKFET